MARSCGIRIGPRRFELVVLDGSPRKHRITAFATGEFPPGGEDPFADAVTALKQALKTHRIPEDAVGIAVDTGMAAFRTLKLPVTEDSKIEQVIKFEVESQLPQWNIDEVIVDFIKLDEEGGDARLLVTALPKSELKRELDLCAKAGIEPLDAEIEATAMVNAALQAEICKPENAQILVHISETSTAVVVVDGGKLRSMRAIHIGALSHEPGAAAAAAASAAAAAAATAEDPAAEPLPADADDAERRLEQNVSRIRRELGRTLSGARTDHPIEAVYVCGWELPGLVGTTLLDVPVYELDAFEEDSGRPAEGAGPLVVPYGVALRHLGAAPLKASLRREELRYSGAFERVELPLAVAGLLLVTWLAIFNIFELRVLMTKENDVDAWRRSADNFLFGNPKSGVAGNLTIVPESLQRYYDSVRKEVGEKDPDRNRVQQIENARRLLLIEVENLKDEFGSSGDVNQPQSALEAMTLVMETLADAGAAAGRVAVRRIDSAYSAGRAGNPDKVEVSMNLSFFADNSVDATRNFEQGFVAALAAQPWVIEPPVSRGSKAFEDGGGIWVDNFVIRCDLSKVPGKEVQQ